MYLVYGINGIICYCFAKYLFSWYLSIPQVPCVRAGTSTMPFLQGMMCVPLLLHSCCGTLFLVTAGIIVLSYVLHTCRTFFCRWWYKKLSWLYHVVRTNHINIRLVVVEWKSTPSDRFLL